MGTIDTWLLWKLTEGKVHATDYTNASRTMLYNIRELKWDKGLLKALNIPESMLPTVMDSSGVFGATSILGTKERRRRQETSVPVEVRFLFSHAHADGRRRNPKGGN